MAEREREEKQNKQTNKQKTTTTTQRNIVYALMRIFNLLYLFEL